MLTNTSFVKTARSMNNPVGEPITQTKLITNPVTDVSNIDIKLFSEIDTYYGIPLAGKLYNNIPADYSQYILLYNAVRDLEISTTNSTVLILLGVLQHLLVGAINAFGIYGQNLMLQTDKQILQTKINDILSSKNVINVEVTCNRGTINMTKTFTLATVFNTYILVYGLPVAGVGFDQVKVKFLATVLQNSGIDPYK